MHCLDLTELLLFPKFCRTQLQRGGKFTSVCTHTATTRYAFTVQLQTFCELTQTLYYNDAHSLTTALSMQ